MAEDLDAVVAKKVDLIRFRKAIQGKDNRAGAILTYQAALETELVRILAVMLPRRELLSNMGFSNLVRVFQASYWAEPEKTDALVQFLRLFGELRNSVAHGDPKKIVDSWVSKLKAHYEAMAGSTADDANASVEDMTSDIAGTLAGLTYRLQKQRPSFP